MDPWICPRCGVVHAYWVARCDCRPPTVTGTGKGMLHWPPRQTNAITMTIRCTCGVVTGPCQVHDFMLWNGVTRGAI